MNMPTQLPASFTRIIEGRVEVWTHESVAVILMNRPDKRNALDDEQIEALEAAFSWFARSPTTHAAVLTGAGDAFCAGGDISMFAGINADTGWTFTRRGYDLLRPLETGRKPMIAAVSGYCLAGGFEIALACDFIIAGASAKFGMAEVNLGLIPGWGGTVRLGKAVPVRLARQLVLTCERLTAERAIQLGLANEVTPDDQLLSRAIALGEMIAGQPPLAVQAARTVLNAIDPSADEALALEGSLAANLFATTEVTSRVRSWIDKARSKDSSS